VDSEIQGGEELELEKLGDLNLVEEEALLAEDEMSEVFPESPVRKYLHIVARRPPAGECKSLSPFTGFIRIYDCSSYHKSTVRTTTRSQLFGAWG
jgi:hypothetical protein